MTQIPYAHSATSIRNALAAVRERERAAYASCQPHVPRPVATGGQTPDVWRAPALDERLVHALPAAPGPCARRAAHRRRWPPLCGLLSGRHAAPCSATARPRWPAPLRRQGAQGITTMLPGEDGVWVAEELARRFGLPVWQFAAVGV